MEQLFHDMCNPYALGWFATQCAVEYTTNEGTPLDVDWYTKDYGNPNSDPELFTGSKVEETIDNNCSFVKSVLNLTLTDDIINNFADHQFLCRVFFFNGTMINDSRGFSLVPERYASSIPCGNESVQSAPLRECITDYAIPEPTT